MVVRVSMGFLVEMTELDVADRWSCVAGRLGLLSEFRQIGTLSLALTAAAAEEEEKPDEDGDDEDAGHNATGNGASVWS